MRIVNDTKKMSIDQNFVWGLGQDTTSPLYALYLPIKDRFIVVHHNLEVLTDLWYLLSSKCNTILVNISSANEYHHTLIDNTICENWTIKNRNKIDILQSSTDGKILDCKDLGLIERDQCTDKDTIDLKEFSLVALEILYKTWRMKNLESKYLAQRMVLGFLSQQILLYHQDNLSQSIQTSLDNHFIELDLVRKNIITEFHAMIYWAENAQILSNQFNNIANPSRRILEECLSIAG